MKDIVFYYTHNTPASKEKINLLAEKYPFAKFKKITTNIVDLVKSTLHENTTNFVWYIDIELYGWEQYLNFDLTLWELQYVYEFMSSSSSIYLVPKDISLDTSNIDFVNKKIVPAKIYRQWYDVFFISFDENNYEKNLRLVKEKRPDVKHVSRVKGIFAAHLTAAKLSTSDFFWVVDADATVIDAFDFNYAVPEWDFDVIHIWKSLNPINGLEYGIGGVKLIPKHLILNADASTAVDVTTSIGAKIKVMDEISNINNSATSPMLAWRSAFRECAKLASGTIARQNQEETTERLNAWITKGGHRPLGEYVKGGASAGKWFGETYKDNKQMLAKINDYQWLALEFEHHIRMHPPEQFKDY